MTDEKDKPEPKDENIFVFIVQAIGVVILTVIGLFVLWGVLAFLAMGYTIMTGTFAP